VNKYKFLIFPVFTINQWCSGSTIMTWGNADTMDG